MFAPSIIAAIHADRVARFEAEARADRFMAEARAARGAARPEPDRRIRRAIGRSIVRFGERIAADAGAEHTAPVGTR
jgi:hypothetical protein